MIEFVQLAAPWVGLAVMLLGAVAVVVCLALLAAGLAWGCVKQIHGLTIVFQALREWHQAHPETSRRYRGKAS